MTPSDLSVLESHLLTHPDDWESWLVYADWLTEQGDAHGKLIVLEHRLAAAPLSAQEQQSLWNELAELVKVHRAEWLLGWPCPPQAQLEWRHGFVRALRIERWNMEGTEMLEALFAHPMGRFVTRLDLEQTGLGNEGAIALARSKNLPRLERLELTDNALGPQAAEALASSSGVRSLEVLGLGRNSIGDEGARALACSDNLRALGRLDLQSTQLSMEGAVDLVRSRHLRSLTELNLSQNDLDQGSIAVILSSTTLSLSQLNLRGNQTEGVYLERPPALRDCAILV